MGKRMLTAPAAPTAPPTMLPTSSPPTFDLLALGFVRFCTRAAKMLHSLLKREGSYLFSGRSFLPRGPTTFVLASKHKAIREETRETMAFAKTPLRLFGRMGPHSFCPCLARPLPRNSEFTCPTPIVILAVGARRFQPSGRHPYVITPSLISPNFSFSPQLRGISRDSRR